MFSKKSEIYLNGAHRHGSLENSILITKVREGDRHDKILEDVFIRSTSENPYHKKVESNIMLCQALKEEMTNDFLEERRNLIRRRNDDDLKDVEQKLRAGYVSKIIAAQNFEKKAMADEARANSHFRNIILQEARLRQDEYAEDDLKRERKRKQNFKEGLLEQMEIKKEKQNQAKLEVMREREMMEEAVRRYREDELREKRTVIEKKQHIRRHIEEFNRTQEQWKTERSLVNQKLEEKAADLQKQNELQQQRAAQAKRERQDLKDKISRNIGEQTYAIEKEKMAGFDQLIELLIDERKAKDEIKSSEERKQKLHERVIARNNLIDMREQRERLRLEQRREEEDLHQEELRILAERDKLQEALDEKKRKRTLEYREALQNSLDEKKRRRAAEMKRLLTENALAVHEKEKREKLVAEQRMELINQHFPAIKGFLHPRMLR